MSGLKIFFLIYVSGFFFCSKYELLVELYKKEVAIFCTTCLIYKSGDDCRMFEKYCHPRKLKVRLQHLRCGESQVFWTIYAAVS